MRIAIFFIFLFFSACATHAPMSEMVMFSRATIPDSLTIIKSGSLTYLQPGIVVKDFEEDFDGSFGSYSDSEFPSFTIQTFKLKNDGSARSLSFGRGLGIDWTKKFKPNYYGSLAISAPFSSKITIHRVFINKRWTGLSSGIFTGLDSRMYINKCAEDYDCSFLQDRFAFLINSGIRTRFLIRDPRSPGLVLTSALELGYIWNSLQPFIGFNISLTSLE